MRVYWQLFYTFVKIGAFTLGGGYAMLPLIKREIVDDKKMIDEQEFVDLLAVAQSVPGVIAINTAIFVGYKIKGIKGSLVTALGAALPSFLIILVVASIFTDIKDNDVVISIFKGIRPAVVALIVVAVVEIGRSMKLKLKTLALPLVVVLLIWGGGISPVFVILGLIVCSLAWGIWQVKRIEKK